MPTLTGVVTGPDGAPIPGVHVSAVAAAEATPAQESYADYCGLPPQGGVATDAGGCYALEVATAGAWRVTVCAELPLLPRERRTVDVGPGGATLDVRLERAPAARMVQGVVVDGEGRPAPARIMVGIYAPSFTRDAGADGRFFVYVPFAYSEVDVHATGDGPATATCRLPLGTADARIQLELKGPA